MLHCSKTSQAAFRLLKKLRGCVGADRHNTTQSKKSGLSEPSTSLSQKFKAAILNILYVVNRSNVCVCVKGDVHTDEPKDNYHKTAHLFAAQQCVSALCFGFTALQLYSFDSLTLAFVFRCFMQLFKAMIKTNVCCLSSHKTADRQYQRVEHLAKSKE